MFESSFNTHDNKIYFIDPEKIILGGVGVGASFNAGDVHLIKHQYSRT